jgi:hypothetical protein
MTAPSNLRTDRKLYKSMGGFVMGSHLAKDARIWLRPVQADPYLGSLLEEVTPETGETDTGLPATNAVAPASARSRIGGSVNKPY